MAMAQRRLQQPDEQRRAERCRRLRYESPRLQKLGRHIEVYGMKGEARWPQHECPEEHDRVAAEFILRR